MTDMIDTDVPAAGMPEEQLEERTQGEDDAEGTMGNTADTDRQSTNMPEEQREEWTQGEDTRGQTIMDMTKTDIPDTVTPVEQYEERTEGEDTSDRTVTETTEPNIPESDMPKEQPEERTKGEDAVDRIVADTIETDVPPTDMPEEQHEEWSQGEDLADRTMSHIDPNDERFGDYLEREDRGELWPFRVRGDDLYPGSSKANVENSKQRSNRPRPWQFEKSKMSNVTGVDDLVEKEMINESNLVSDGMLTEQEADNSQPLAISPSTKAAFDTFDWDDAFEDHEEQLQPVSPVSPHLGIEISPVPIQDAPSEMFSPAAKNDASASPFSPVSEEIPPFAENEALVSPVSEGQNATDPLSQHPVSPIEENAEANNTDISTNDAFGRPVVLDLPTIFNYIDDPSRLEDFLDEFNHHVNSRLYDAEYLVTSLQRRVCLDRSGDLFKSWRREVFVDLQNKRWMVKRKLDLLRKQSSERGVERLMSEKEELERAIDEQAEMMTQQREAAQNCVKRAQRAKEEAERARESANELQARISFYRDHYVNGTTPDTNPASSPNHTATAAPNLTTTPTLTTDATSGQTETDDFVPSPLTNKILMLAEKIRELVVVPEQDRIERLERQITTLERKKMAFEEEGLEGESSGDEEVGGGEEVAGDEKVDEGEEVGGHENIDDARTSV